MSDEPFMPYPVCKWCGQPATVTAARDGLCALSCDRHKANAEAELTEALAKRSVAGSPDLNKPLRSEAEVLQERIDAALSHARDAVVWAEANPSSNSWPLKNALRRIDIILTGGK